MAADLLLDGSREGARRGGIGLCGTALEDKVVAVYARTTKDKSERIIVIANTTAKIRGYKIPELKGATLLASTYGNREATLLRSYEVRVYKVKK